MEININPFKPAFVFSLIFFVSCSKPKTISNQPIDYSTATHEQLMELHTKGDIDATYTLGFNLLFNEDASIKENVVNAEAGLNFLETAHENGHLNAHSSLSLIYENGLFDFPADNERANEYNLEGAKRGSSTGKINFGLRNLNSENKETAQLAHDYLFDVAEEENLGGIANEYLAHLYYFGSEHFEVDYEAGRLFSENCILFQNPNGWCEYILARDLSQGLGGPKEINRSSLLFNQAGDKGHAAAMWYSGMNALNGIGVEKSEKNAFDWVRKSAEHNYLDGITSLAVMYALGQGTEIDYQKSYTYYDRAATHGSAHAIRSMAAMHCDGNGRDINDEVCFSGVFLAMEHGDKEASLFLKDRFVISDDQIKTISKTRPAQEKFWTSKFPWLVKNEEK